MTHNINLICQIEKYDKDGNLIKSMELGPQAKQENLIRLKTHETDITFPMRSFNRNIAGFFHYNMYSATSVPANYVYSSTGGTPSGDIFMLGLLTPGVGNLQGLTVGTGSLTASMYNYNLQYLCTHGTGVGQLSYQGHTWTAPYLSGSTYVFSLARDIINNSPSQIDISEIKMSVNPIFYYLITYDTVNISGSVINVSVPTSSLLSVWNYFTIDPDGPLTYNFLNMLYSGYTNASVTLTSFSGSSVLTSYNQPSFWKLNYGVGDSWRGIIVGSGSSEPFNLTGSKLQGHITEGTGSNQLYYGITAETHPPILEGTSSISHGFQRAFLNLANTSVSVGECCLNVRGSSEDTKNAMMIARNVFPSPISLDYLESIVITYKFIYNC